jgi:hypothetical protein
MAISIPPELITAFISGLIGPIALMYAKSKIENKKKPDMVTEAL